MGDDQPLKLIYIAGYGRSGTTLLDIALGQHQSILGAGEITTLARHVWENSEYCACGTTVPQCALWKPIVERWGTAEASEFLPEYGESQEPIERLISLERMFSRLHKTKRVVGYFGRTLNLVQEISAVSGRRIIVDSSKLPGRAFAMSKLPSVKLYVVHVVRDGRGVAWSLMKSYGREVEKGVQRDLKPKPLIYTAARWAVVNLATEVLRLRLGRGRSLRVRYEDFMADPAGTLNRIIALVGEDAPPNPYREGDPLLPQHQVAGSRHRMQDKITLRSDEGWKGEMPARKQRAFSILCAPLLWWYGYPLGVSKGSSARQKKFAARPKSVS